VPLKGRGSGKGRALCSTRWAQQKGLSVCGEKSFFFSDGVCVWVDVVTKKGIRLTLLKFLPSHEISSVGEKPPIVGSALDQTP
jgi:hypothetical protein